MKYCAYSHERDKYNDFLLVNLCLNNIIATVIEMPILWLLEMHLKKIELYRTSLLFFVS